ncbi:MAG: S-methyl-5'-thioinosine phosphorylase [Woeseia sp.]
MTNLSQQFAIIGGSGFATFGGDSAGETVSTRYGAPSSPLKQLQFANHNVYVVVRHGEDHDIPPHAINYCANLAALKNAGVSSVIAINTVGAIRHDFRPGQLVVPTQLIDYTWGRVHSIYHEPCATLDHIDFTEPFSPGLRAALLEAAGRAETECHDGGVYGVTQGPRLETLMEVNKLERDGVDIVGMTAMPEAAIARELGMEYACLSLVVNMAAGRGDKAIHEDIEDSTMTAKMQAMRVLKAFFQRLEND